MIAGRRHAQSRGCLYPFYGLVDDTLSSCRQPRPLSRRRQAAGPSGASCASAVNWFRRLLYLGVNVSSAAVSPGTAVQRRRTRAVGIQRSDAGMPCSSPTADQIIRVQKVRFITAFGTVDNIDAAASNAIHRLIAGANAVPSGAVKALSSWRSRDEANSGRGDLTAGASLCGEQSSSAASTRSCRRLQQDWRPCC